MVKLFDDPKQLMAHVFLNPIHLIDLNTYPDDQLSQFKLVGVMSRLMKHIGDKDLLQALPDVLNSINDMYQILIDGDQNAICREKVLNFLRNSLAYIFSEAPELKESKIINMLVAQAAEPLKEEIMSLADVLREEGREEGKEKAKLETARKMIELGAENSFITKATGLSKEQLDALKQEK